MNFSGISSRGLIGQVLRFPLKFIPRNAVVPILQGPLRGKRWIAGSSNHGCWLGSYEFEKQQVFIEAIQSGDVIYDIGAHVGFYTLLSSKLAGTKGHVVAFEPFPSNVQFLQKHLKLNGVDNVTVIEKAVSDQPGQVAFEIAQSSTMGHLTKNKNAASSIMVDVVALDQFIDEAQLPLPDVLKVDIEGAEYDFLRGASQLLSSRPIKIFLATHGAEVHANCLAFLRGLGYQLTSLEDKPLETCSEVLAIKKTAI
jgi:FkbM family methyltransferase